MQYDAMRRLGEPLRILDHHHKSLDTVGNVDLVNACLEDDATAVIPLESTLHQTTSRPNQDHVTTPSPKIANDIVALRNDSRRMLSSRHDSAFTSLPRTTGPLRRWRCDG
ncbi:hypothetical protein H9Q70_011463 [Fusarium xylarioides]|nr:hypothetical protein H9Q70_011463 [Fusarium xylarioides]KAG5775632.1 hypothetical protein H9Q73_010694 [Fusarium xylarioides]